MKYIEEFRNRDMVQQLAWEIRKISKHPVAFMEVCGGHTHAIRKFGIPSLLPEHITLLSGPGCPVCVSSTRYVDQAIAYSRLPDVIVATFGDMIRIPGSSSSLDREKAEGRDIRIVWSALDAVTIAKKNPDKKVILLAIGFETTAPATAISVVHAYREKVDNFYFFSAHKIMPPAMEALIDEGVRLDGYLAPGHVSTITGAGIYRNITEKYGKACVIAGFEPVDILRSVFMLVKQVEENTPKVEIQYTRVVRPEGNLEALQLMEEVYELRDDWWRGLGMLPASGLGLQNKYAAHDAEKMIEVEVEDTVEPKGCICGEVLKGVKKPVECPLFGTVCTPENPVGACMVSPEGACQAWYMYRSNNETI
ncbi:MAG: hydrogenase formation protein HypD [Bacteroidales bacterium]|nr:hydrogenase formation protein HypD [Bacteroidales bacterium]